MDHVAAKAAELTPLDAQTLTEAFFEGALDAFLIIDAEGRIVHANAATQGLLGYDPRRLRGERVELLVPARFKEHARQRATYTGNPHPRSMGLGLELFALHADGREIPVDISLTSVDAGGRRLVFCAMRDVRGRAYSGDTLRVQATALRSAASGIVITDRDGIIKWVNPAACAITGYASDELIGEHTRKLKSGRHEPEFYRALWETVLGGHTWSGTIVNRRKDGTLYDEEQTIAPVLDERGEITHFIAIKQDVTEKHRLQEALERAREELAARMVEIEALNARLQEQAVRDPLTKLYNRRYLSEVLRRDIALAQRSGQPLSVVMIDLDHFKDVNDTWGHAVGDRVLQELAEVLLHHARESDMVCRLGGEEFLVVMPGADPEAARARAEEWREAFAAARVPAGETPVSCSFSAGVASYRADDRDSFAALHRADRALYEAKRQGRNRVVSSEG